MDRQIRERAPSLPTDSIQHTYLAYQHEEKTHAFSNNLPPFSFGHFPRLVACLLFLYGATSTQQIRPASEVTASQPKHLLSPAHQTSQAYADHPQHMQDIPQRMHLTMCQACQGWKSKESHLGIILYSWHKLSVKNTYHPTWFKRLHSGTRPPKSSTAVQNIKVNLRFVPKFNLDLFYSCFLSSSKTTEFDLSIFMLS